MRTFSTRDQQVMRTLWISIVQPHIDYCSQLWAPHKAGEINRIEALFRSYTHRIPAISHLNYWERLSALKLYSQERRLERYRVIYTWKTIEGITPSVGITTCNSPRLGRFCKVPTLGRHSTGKIRTLRQNSPTVRGPQLFNSLPPDIRNITGCATNIFKNKLDRYLSQIPDKPRTPGYPMQAESNSIVHMCKIKC